jgi:putative PEP-CTERM system TPR-repeat lipoprotein
LGVDMRSSCSPSRPFKGKYRLGLVLITSLVLAACGASPESMVNSAKDYLAKNDLNAASIQLKNALQQRPDLGEARYLLGLVNLEQGDPGGAVKNLRRAIDAGYQNDMVWGALARAMAIAGESDALLKEFDGKVVADPIQKAHILAALGDVRLSNRQQDQARENYQAALAGDPTNVRGRAGMARLKAIGGDLPGALEELDQALAQKASPEQADVYALKAGILLAQNKPDDAVAALESAVKVKPNAVGVHFTLISLLLRQNKPEIARERLADMQKAVGKNPAALYLQAYMSYRQGKLTEARDGVEQVIRTAPNFLPGRLLAGTIYLQLNEQQQAQANLQKVLEKVPGQPLARRMMVASLLATKDVSRAEDTLRPLLESGKNDSAVLSLAGQVYLAKGDFDRSAEYFERVVHLDPKNVQAMTRLGVAKLAGGETEEAFEDLESAAKLDDASGQADIALILAHLRRNEFDKALAAQAILEHKQPDNPQTYNLKGGILLAKKDLAGARKAFEKALSLQPTFLPAAANLVRIDLAEKRPEDAKKRFESMIAKDPKLVLAYLGLAELQGSSGAPAGEVEATLKRAIAANTASVVPKLALARFYLQTNEVKKALALVQEAEASAPEDPTTVELLARAHIAAGDTRQGLASFGKLVSLQPQSSAPLVELADAQALSKDYAGAERSLRKALDLKSDFVPAQRRLIMLYLRDKREGDALALARAMQKQRPGAAIGFAMEGDVHASVQKWPEAVSAYRKAYQTSKMAETLVALHAALNRAGSAAEADRLAEDWIRAQPNDMAVRGYLAERAMATNKPAEAVKYYEAILKIAPNNPLVLNNLAFAAGQVNDARALGYAEEALKLAPANPAVLDTYGMLLVNKGEVAKGLTQLEKAKAGAPKAYAIRINLAQAYIKADRKPDAKRELQSVVEEATDQTPVKARAEALLKTL